jgi:hypothetical protein
MLTAVTALQEEARIKSDTFETMAIIVVNPYKIELTFSS